MEAKAAIAKQPCQHDVLYDAAPPLTDIEHNVPL